MDNPFEKRATEYILEPLALLPLVSPEPIEVFLAPQNQALFEKLTIWVGTPGCGKTTIARVLEFDCLWALSGPSHRVNGELASLLSSLGIMEDGLPRILTHRVPITSNFRGIWELPYEPALKDALLRAFVQSKAVLGWLRHLERIGVNLADVEVELREESDSIRSLLGARDAESFKKFAQQVELSVFKVVTALIPPRESVLASEILNVRYDIFEDIKGIRVNKWPYDDQSPSTLKPMVIVDDAHELHVKQFTHLQDWLKSRVLQISRWIMCRADVVPPDIYRDAVSAEESEDDATKPGTTIGRDYYVKLMRLNSRNAKRFRKVASDVADRYFTRLPSLAAKHIRHMNDALAQTPPRLALGNESHLRDSVERAISSHRMTHGVINTLRSRIPENLGEDERWAVLKILVHREINNKPQLSLLADEASDVQEEEREAKGVVRASLVDGARVQLMHDYKRPYYFGIEKLSDASNANIEQFIGLAGPLVDALLTRIIRGKDPTLPALAQHQALQRRATELMATWDFPYCNYVRILVDWISARCLERTMLPHAPLDDGANAFGVQQHEIDAALNKSDRLARALHYAFSYKALVMVPDYKCKGKVWCLFELGGIPILAKGLTLNRGGFIEGKLSQLDNLLTSE